MFWIQAFAGMTICRLFANASKKCLLRRKNQMVEIMINRVINNKRICVYQEFFDINKTNPQIV